MIPPLQSLVKYDNAVLVSSTKEKKSKEKLLKVQTVAGSAGRSCLAYLNTLRNCRQEACCLVSKSLKYRKQRTYSTQFYLPG